MDGSRNEGATPPRPLAAETYERLKRRIMRLELAPGQWVTERMLAAELEVGLTPVRMAMARLSTEGLVVTVPRRGYEVRRLVLADADELFAAWRVIGMEIMRLATLAMTPESLQAYEDLTVRGRSDAADDDADDVGIVLDLATEQWHFLAQLARNRHLEDVLLRLEAQVSRLCALGLYSRPAVGSRRRSERRDPEILDVFRRRDVAAALALTDELMTTIQDDVRKAFADDGTGLLNSAARVARREDPATGPAQRVAG